FVEWLAAADMESLAWSLRILCVLAQTKAYLYWCRDLTREELLFPDQGTRDFRVENHIHGPG
ncbi:hypothetical protein KAW53_02535, partial [Candidatus Bathyarchaeota archaeon]|nr:hypothetical protein [Candidatus Bathyarchaeota archaeon]